MTIEFLRARLLSERSVSRTARQRADELAKRVDELEEQLKFVSIQRKKAEKAAAVVLAILENHGINDFFEAFDSSSDQDEVLCELKENNNPVKEDDLSMTSKSRSGPEEGLSGSEIEASRTPGRSLSWKSGSNRLNSFGRKNLAQSRRRHGSIISIGSSPKYRLGKSCREIKRREQRVVAENARDDQENGVATAGLGNTSNQFDYEPENLNGCLENVENSMFQENQQKENRAGLQANGIDRYGDMERALEQQAQLIGRFEAEENAQREWEEKYRENNYTVEPQDSCEPGNQSDITEEKNEPQTNEDTEPIDTVSSFNGVKQKPGKVCSVKEATTETPSNGRVPAVPAGRDQNKLLAGNSGQQLNRKDIDECEMGFPEFVFPAQGYSQAKMKGKQSDDRVVVDSKFQPLPHELPIDGSAANSSFQGDGKFFKGEVSGRQNRLRGTPHKSSSSLGGVLEALQRAKVSLQHELNSSSPGQGAMITLPDSRVQSMKATDAMDLSLGSAGLFRVPTDFQNYNSLYSSFSTPYSDFGSTRHSADANFGTLSSYHYPSSPYIEPRSRISGGQPYFNPYDLGSGIPAVGAYFNPQMDLSRAIVPSNDRHPAPYSDTRPGMPTGDRYSLYGDRFRSGMYR